MKFHERKLNEFEKVFLKLNLSSPFNVLINVQMASDIKREVLEKALSRIKLNNYYLNFSIQTGENPKFVYTKKPISIEELEYNNNQERIELIQKELNTSSVYDEHPPAKLIVLKNNGNTDLILKISHIVSDGISAYSLIEQLLYHVNNIETGIDTILNQDNEIYPNLTFFPQWNLDNFEKLTKVKESECTRNNIDLKNRSTHIIEKDFSIEESHKIFSFCKQKRISVNSFLMACLVKPMANKLKSEGYSSITLKTSSGLNLRKYYDCNIDDQILGFWSGFGYLFYNIEDDLDDLVDFSRRYQADLKSYLSNNLSFFYLKTALDNYLDKDVEEISSHYSRQLPYVLLTNLGKLNINRNYIDKFMIGKINLMTPMHRNWIDDLGFGICASTTNDKLNLIFNYMSPAWKRKNAQNFADSIINCLKNFS